MVSLLFEFMILSYLFERKVERFTGAMSSAYALKQAYCRKTGGKIWSVEGRFAPKNQVKIFTFSILNLSVYPNQN